MAEKDLISDGVSPRWPLSTAVLSKAAVKTMLDALTGLYTQINHENLQLILRSITRSCEEHLRRLQNGAAQRLR